MTVIVGYTFEDTPVIVGDALISQVLRPEQDAPSILLDTPARNNVNRFLGDYAWAEVAYMKQKINIMNKHVIVGWSGSETQAKAALRDIKEWSIKNKKDTSSFSSLIRSIPERDLDDCSLLGFARGKTHTNVVYCNMIKYDQSPFDNLWISGSGQNDVVNILSHVDFDALERSRNDKRKSYTAAIAAALELSAKCFSFDFFSGLNLKSFWGGAMEVACFSNKQAKKVDDILYAFWVYTNEESEIKHFGIEPIFVKINYQNSNMIIRVLKLKENGTSDAEFHNKFFVVRPLLLPEHERNATHVTIRVPDMSCKFLCSTVLRLRDNAIIGSVSDVVYCNNRRSPILFSQDDKHIDVRIYDPYHRHILMKAMKRFHSDYNFNEDSLKISHFNSQDEMTSYVRGVPSVE